MKSFFQLFLFSLITISLSAQPIQQPDAAEILHSIQKLKVLGTALYVAAHPDDENTRLIAWLANEKMVRTAYLSMTRGDGGQNLIGPEIRDKLGIIRTQELLAARRIDRANQYFTRANDFGYSKSPEETFDVWNEEKILGDVVWVIRKFKPDVIITRFPTTGQGGHGHHTGSAILAQKAFELAGDPKAYPDQLQYVDIWKPRRLMLNTGRWWNPDMTGEEPGVLTVDVGEYNPLLGISYTEMAAISRSQHKSQGFGATGSRGEANEYLEYKKGSKAEEELFEGVNTTWSRVNAASVEKKINSIISNYDPLNPHNSAESLLQLRKEISKISDNYWKKIKLHDIDIIIKDLLGLYLEAVAADPYLVPGEDVDLVVELTNRSSLPLNINLIRWPDEKVNDSTFVIANNIEIKKNYAFVLDRTTPYSTPYWLRQRPEKGYYQVNDQQLIGKAENDPALSVQVRLNVKDQLIDYSIPVYYKWNSPVEGEQRRPVAVVPPVALDFGEEIYLFPDKEDKQVVLKVRNLSSAFSGNVKLALPAGWRSEPEQIKIQMDQKLAEQNVIFTITPPAGQSSVLIKALVESGDGTYSSEVDEMIYEHIPPQVLVSPADAEFVKLDVNINGKNIGYVEGAGDAIPSTLNELGYTVTYLSEEAVKGDLNKYDAIILGIRALNANPRIGFIMDDLLKYVSEGGVLISQYNTSHRLQTKIFAPYPLSLSRDRVTVEDSPVEILSPDHPAMSYPNKITPKDFDNWVQERGLYFPNEWSEEYEPLLSMADPGEEKTRGSLLVAQYGKGYYVYSGISWFRQLPAGVPGTIRIFANLLSLGNKQDAK